MDKQQYPVVPYDYFTKYTPYPVKPPVPVKYEIVVYGQYRMNLQPAVRQQARVWQEITEIQEEIESGYEKPTPARLTHNLLNRAARYLILSNKRIIQTLVSWLIFILRGFYKNLLRDKSSILNAFIVLGILLIGCVSYSMAAEIYTEMSALDEFGKGFEVKETVTYELGSPVILEPQYFLQETSMDYADTVKLKSPLISNPHYIYDPELKTVRGYGVDFLPCGEYLVQVCYSDLIKETKIIVQDTTPPDLSSCELYNTRYINVIQGTAVIDLRSMIAISVQDYSLEESRVSNYSQLKVLADTSQINTSIPGKHYIDVVVEDKYGNQTEPFTVTINVQKKGIQKLREVKQNTENTETTENTENTENTEGR